MKLLFALLFVVGLVAVSQASMKCDICEGCIEFLEDEMISKEGTLEDKVNKYCEKLRIGFLVKLCDKLLDKEIEKVGQDIENKEPPQKVCEKIHLC